jgi:hypothetical protein
VVVLPKAALAQLKTHRAKQGKEGLLLGAGYKDEDLIFARANGSPWPPTQLSSEFARLARKRGIRIRFHDLRHTHATHLLKAGVPVRVVSERLGHAAASITLDVYAHVLPGQQQEAAAKVDAMLGRMAVREQSLFLSARSVVSTARDYTRPEGAFHDQDLQADREPDPRTPQPESSTQTSSPTSSNRARSPCR